MSEIISSFEKVIDDQSQILILGSIPGIVSLQQQQYYANPRNGFWSIMAQLLDFDVSLEYPQRIEQLQLHGIALWDVVSSCKRIGSLDQSIETTTIMPNDFAALFNRYKIKQVLLNGTKAFQLFVRYVVKTGLISQEISYHKLPSTSPAYAAMSQEDKAEIWIRCILEAGLIKKN